MALKTLNDVFQESRAKHPRAVALFEGQSSFTYEELDAWSDAVAQDLAAEAVSPGDRVALRRDAGAALVAALLGILKAGASYVPLDIRNPAERNTFIARDAGVVGLLGEPWAGVDIPVLDVPALERCRADAKNIPGAHEPPNISPGDTAYVIYTSGTTGTPKGVPITHANVVSLLTATDSLFSFRADDVWLLFHSIAFDFSVWEIWGALAYGASIVVLPRWDTRDPEVWLEAVKAYGVTVLNQTPTAFSTWCRTSVAAERRDQVQSLRYVIFGGEALTGAVLAPWFAAYGDSGPTLVNMYGITETTVHATFRVVTVDDAHGSFSLIGKPLPGFDYLVTDELGQPVRRGVQGELLLSGPQVTNGYLNRPELVSERFLTRQVDERFRLFYRSGDFVREDEDGLAYLGRMDRQVKIRGHRIELGEIESAVQAHPAIADVAADVYSFWGSTDMRICCTYTVVGQVGPPTSDLRAHVSKVIPAYMRPTHYLRVDILPQTQNGKVDHRMLTNLWKEHVQCSAGTP